MAITAASLVAKVSVIGALEAAAQIGTVGKASQSASEKMSTLALGATVLAVAGLVAFGAASTKMAGDFQQGVNRLVTGAGDVTDNMGKMGQSILGVSTTTGILTSGTQGLNAAMYQIISANQRGAQAIDTLSVAAKGAVIEQANVVDVSKALTTAMVDYGTKQFNATGFMNGYIVATQRGKLSLEQLSTSMGPILPLAQNIGISFADVAGAMSTMTNAGIPAERAATSLRFLFQSLENPTHKATTAMKEFGLNSVSLANELKVSLPGALQMVYDAATKAGPAGSVPFNRAVSDMIGGQRSLQAYLSLTGTHLATFKDNTTAVGAAMKNSQAGVLGWNVAQSNLNVQLGRAHAAVDALMINLGTQLLPVVTKLVAGFASFVSWLSQGSTGAKAVEIAIGVVTVALLALVASMATLKVVSIVTEMGKLIATIPGLVAGFIAWAGGAWTAAAGMIAATWPILLIIAGVALLVAGIILLVTHWTQVTTFLRDVWGAVSTWVISTLKDLGAWFANVWNAIVLTTQVVWSLISSAVQTGLRDVAGFFTSVWNGILGGLRAAWAWIVGIVQIGLTTLWNSFTAPFRAIGALFSWLYDHNYYFKMLVDKINQIIQEGLALVRYLWQSAINWLVGLWNELSNLATTAWNLLKDSISTIVTAGLTWLRNAWTTVVNWLTNQWHILVTIASSIWTTVTNAIKTAWSATVAIVTSVWQQISAVFASAWSMYISGPVSTLWANVSGAFTNAWKLLSTALSGLWNNITSAVAGWASLAYQWGVNLIQGFINGIGAMLGSVGNAIGNIANTVKNGLGFHSPTKEGPGSDSDKWAPAFVNMFVAGLTAGIPRIQAAVQALAKPIALTLNASNVGTGAQSSFAGSSSSMGFPAMSAPSAGAAQIVVQPAPVYLDGRLLSQGLMPHIVNTIRVATGVTGM